MRTETEIKELLKTSYADKLLTDSQKKILQDDTVPDIYEQGYAGEMPAEESDRLVIAWKYDRITTEKLFGQSTN